MHPQVTDFIERIKRAHPTKFIGVDVLDVGSLDINGTNGHHFYKSKYLGVDIGSGPNVDLVIDPTKPLPFDDASFDAVVSTEAMEHNEHYEHTIQEMVRVLRPGGLLLMTMAGYNRPEHGTAHEDPAASPHTLDWYSNIYVKDIADIMQWELYFFPFAMEYGGAYDLYVWGVKK